MNHEDAIELPDDEKCAFCAYLSGERPYTIAGRNQQIAVLVTREQRGTPHLLVIPIRHVRTVLDIDDEEAKALMVGVRQTALAITRSYGRAGIAIWQNNGIPADQTISHVHYHVAGTLEGGGTNRGSVEELSLAATEEIAQQITPYLNI